MSRYHFTKKDTVEDSKRISLARLKQWGLMPGWHSGTLTWRNAWCENKINFVLDTIDSNPYMRLQYTITRDGDEKKNMDYKVRLTTKPCNLGGQRYWFICPLVKEGYPCRRIVSTLFCPPGYDYYGCRQCYDLTYAARQDSKPTLEYLSKVFTYERKMEELEPTIKRKFYAGKRTKRYSRYLSYAAKCNMMGGIVLKHLQERI